MAEKKKGGAVPAEALEQLCRLDNQLCFAVYSASNLITRLYRPLLEPLGITYPQYLALLALWERSPRTVGELGDALGLDSGTLTPLLKRLEANGIVVRKRAPEDERRVLIELTPAGQKLRARAASVPVEMLCKLQLPLEEAARLRDTLKRLTRGLREPPDGNEG
ncbi:MAG TPA: MarR family transcriptional regulator [Archangium sp.]|uniref:MarR family winged helix-turn-helix transcriptional regulator n=1 Tax=Archangium sp. TaxID=1872627 RepID=UPI002E3252D1|nr:MarR family transcriptional regulator [Archangium sp.]HEX5746272.1 MarR family transcriptional regulator [Archangium sp.]